MARLRIKQIRSGIGRLGDHKRVLRALGLKHPGSVVEHGDGPTIIGMIEKVKHLISVEVIEEEKAPSETE
ncbi:MAG: 50S ribosomal protein L30 [Candidatus Eisenbacteria bacterium]